jgi:isoleucyl-tRNA synthetase
VLFRSLELEVDDALRAEGLARTVLRQVQVARQSAGLDVTDRIALSLGGDEALLAAVRAHEDYVAGETLATSVSYDGAEGDPLQVDGLTLHLAVARA